MVLLFVMLIWTYTIMTITASNQLLHVQEILNQLGNESNPYGFATNPNPFKNPEMKDNIKKQLIDYFGSREFGKFIGELNQVKIADDEKSIFTVIQDRYENEFLVSGRLLAERIENFSIIYQFNADDGRVMGIVPITNSKLESLQCNVKIINNTPTVFTVRSTLAIETNQCIKRDIQSIPLRQGQLPGKLSTSDFRLPGDLNDPDWRPSREEIWDTADLIKTDPLESSPEIWHICARRLYNSTQQWLIVNNSYNYYRSHMLIWLWIPQLIRLIQAAYWRGQAYYWKQQYSAKKHRIPPEPIGA